MTSCSENRVLLLIAAIFAFSGCAAAKVPAAERGAPSSLLSGRPLAVTAPSVDRESPQAARTVAIRWKVRARGGVGPVTYTFWVFDGTGEIGVQKGPLPEWEWRPESAGRYRVKAVMTDALGNRAESAWSEEYAVAPPLAVAVPVPDRKSPQVARTVAVRWKTSASGGVGAPSVGFVVSDGVKETEVKKGPLPEWEWRPESAGRYRVKAVMTDALGNRAESAWSEEYAVAATIGRQARIAVFPVENLSGTAAPSRELAEGLKKSLAARKIRVLDDQALETFMTKHRVRYTGGLTGELGRAFRTEQEVDAVLITYLDLYDESGPPKIGISARLVSTEEETAILWMDDVSLSGDQRPGLLGLGLVADPGALKVRALDRVVDSIDGYLSGTRKVAARGASGKTGGGAGNRNRYLPRGSFRQPNLRTIRKDRPIKVAVLPFLDRSGRPHAGEVMADLFLRGFAERRGVDVVEPGVVRQSLLQSRLIMEGGLSFPQAELLHELLEVDYVISGEVMDFQDSKGYEAAPYVEYSVYIIDANRRQVVWTSSNYDRGDEHVILFDWGKTYTAGALVSDAVRTVTDLFLEEGSAPMSTGDAATEGSGGLP